MSDETEKSGKDGITRRDFLDGVAVSAAGLAVAAAMPYLSGAEAAMAAGIDKSGGAVKYPPSAAGIGGVDRRTLNQTIKIDGLPNPGDTDSTKFGPGIEPKKRDIIDVDGVYDLVVVGAGASGLASAKYYQDRFGKNKKILIIDPMEDFGGHARRNELHIPDATRNGQDTMILQRGGSSYLEPTRTWNRATGNLLDIPGSYGQPSVDMLAYLGIDPDNFPSGSGPGLPATLGMRSVVLFPKDEWGEDILVPGKLPTQTLSKFLATTPFSKKARKDIKRILEDETTDWITLKDGPKTDQEKKAILARISYKDYLKRYLGVGEEALIYFERNPHGLFGVSTQAVPAGDMWALGQPGFAGLGLNGDIFPGIARTPQFNIDPDQGEGAAWPDGNASVVRLLVSKLIPNAFPDVDGARPNQETIVVAQCRYSELDQRDNKVRIRLNSAVAHVKPNRGKLSNAPAEITYIRDDNVGERVRAKHVVMACWGRVTARIVEGLPDSQVKDLCYARKTPLISARVGLRNWQAFFDAKINSITPRGHSLFWDSASLSVGAKFGDVYGPTPNTPAQPAVLSLAATPNDPDSATQLESYERGRQILLTMSFEDFEKSIIELINRTVNESGGNFDPKRDIESIIINRWSYGYAYEYSSLYDPSLFGPVADQPHVRGRRPFKNVAIANSDAGAFAYIHGAINEAYRAVNDLPG